MRKYLIKVNNKGTRTASMKIPKGCDCWILTDICPENYFLEVVLPHKSHDYTANPVVKLPVQKQR